MPAPPDAAAVAEAFGLAHPVGLTTVVGAWSNRVFRLDTAVGSYAVKELTNLWSSRASASAWTRHGGSSWRRSPPAWRLPSRCGLRG